MKSKLPDTLHSRHALILGASGGIGRASALALAASGVADHFTLTYGGNAKRVHELAEELRDNHGAHAKVAQLSFPLSDDSVPHFESFLSSAVDIADFEISIMVNCIGDSPNVPLETQTLAGENGWERIFAVHLFSAFLVTRAMTQRMAFRDIHGSVVLVGSSNGDNSYADYSLPYDLAKGGVHDVVRNLSETLMRRHGIRINGVAPGWVNTSEGMAPPSEEELRRETAKIFRGRFAAPSEIGEVVAFLASKKASYITGQTIRVDGGYRG